MKNVKNSIYAQIAYMIGMGFGFLFIPEIILPIFGFDQPADVWVRVLGALVLVFASYYYAGASNELIPFLKSTVYGRYVFCSILALLALLGYGKPVMYLFAAVEVGLACWTHLGLKKIGKFNI